MYRLPLVLDRRSGEMHHFDIIHRIAQEAQTCAKGQHTHPDTKKQAPADLANACPILLPRPDSNQRPGA